MSVTPAAPSRRLPFALAALVLASAPSLAAPEAKPVAGQQVRFPQGIWSALPQTGPDGKVRQCVLVAPRQRAGKDGPVNTRFSLNISRGSGFVFLLHDDGLPSEPALDDQAEIVLGDRSFSAVSFQVASTAHIFHPGDAAATLEALGKAKQVRLRSEGTGVDSGVIDIDLPQEALNWLKARALMKSPVSDNFEFPVQASVIPWLRACSRRNGIAIEPVGQ